MNILRQYRAQIGMTQGELARMARCDRSYLSRIESGERIGSLAFWRRIGRVLNIDWWRLTEEEEAENDILRDT